MGFATTIPIASVGSTSQPAWLALIGVAVALAAATAILIYGIFRYLYLVHRHEEGGSPSDVLLTDRPLAVAVVLWAVAVVAIVYTAPGLPVPRGD